MNAQGKGYGSERNEEGIEYEQNILYETLKEVIKLIFLQNIINVRDWKKYF